MYSYRVVLREGNRSQTNIVTAETMEDAFLICYENFIRDFEIEPESMSVLILGFAPKHNKE